MVNSYSQMTPLQILLASKSYYTSNHPHEQQKIRNTLRNTLLTAAQSDYIIIDNMLRNMLCYLYAEVLLMMLTSRYFKPKCLEAPITGASKLFVHTSSDTELMKSMMSSYDRLLLVKALMSSSV